MTPRAPVTTLCIAACLTGCASRKPQPVPPPQVRSASSERAFEAPQAAAPTDQQSIGWATTPLPVRSEPVAVKEGPAPLFYLVEAPGTFRVFDQTARQDLARSAAPGRSIVRVDGRTGVVVAGETLAAGPLPRDHRYVIFREPEGPNMARQGVFQLTPHHGGGGGATTQRPAQSATQDSSQGSSQAGGHDSEGGPDVRQ